MLLATDTRTLPALACAHPGRLGFLLTPRGGHDPAWVAATFPVWCCDNDAFSGFDAQRYQRMLARVANTTPGPRWVTAPDVVADAAATLALFEAWGPHIAGLGLPVALVLQDGQERRPLPDADAYFVGGLTNWKLGPAAAELVREAKRRGRWVHMGRCSTLRRLERAARLGCDSADGSIFSRQPAKWLPRGLKWLRRIERQPALW